MRTHVVIRSFFLSIVLMGLSAASFAQIGISVAFGPPALPVYEQPLCPGDGYIWTPGYWGYGDGDYYWVPGTWIEAPEVGFLWTPGYWGWGGSAFFFHEGYWGSHVGFYGGVDYGFGYGGHGYEGGRWENNHFYYNTYANRVDDRNIHNTYNTRIEVNTGSHVSYNGGNGGINERASAQEDTYGRERHTAPVAAQNQQNQQARSNPELRASANQGKPPIAATSRAGDFKSSAEPAKNAGAPYKAPERTAAASEASPANSRAVNPASNNHASELPAHKYTPPDTGNAATDRKYQQQQDNLAAKQNQDHQKLQQQQDREHQQAATRSSNEVQKQQLEQRHTQQTQQLEQKHTVQQQKMQTRQSPPQQRHPPSQKP